MDVGKERNILEYQPLTSQYDADVADLIRVSLKANHLDIPGTVYFDEGLDHLSEYYSDPHRAYYVLLERDSVIGCIGLAEFQYFGDDCCELQKLYVSSTYQGRGLGYKLVRFIESKAREMGYRKIYLETHTNLQTAIQLYEVCGYQQIQRPESVVHSTMNRFYLKEL